MKFVSTDVDHLSKAAVHRIENDKGEAISFLKIYPKGSVEDLAYELLGQKKLKGNSYDVTSPQSIVSIDVNGEKRIGLFIEPAQGKK